MEESRVNIVSSPFSIIISDHLPHAASDKRLRAHRPAASNDQAQMLTYKQDPATLLDTKTPDMFSQILSSSTSGAAPSTPSNHALEAKARQLQEWEESLRQQREELNQQRANSNASYPSTPNYGASSKASKTDEAPPPPAASVDHATPIVTPSFNKAPAKLNSNMSPEAAALFRKNRAALQALFNTYASNDQVSLEQFFSLCSDFDLFPTFLNKDGINSCFDKSSSTGYVNFELFTNALYEVAIHALSKSTFAEIYPTSESKVGGLFCCLCCLIV